jgi:hypothetical protein
MIEGVEPKTISCNKKRGRPFNVSINVDAEQKATRKNFKPAVITESNSILKYFGAKVEIAIALPSKSVNEMEIKDESMSESVSKIIENSIKSINKMQIEDKIETISESD